MCTTRFLPGLAAIAVTAPAAIGSGVVFLRPAKGGDLLARAELLRAGRSKISGIVRLQLDGAPDRPVSHVTGSDVHIQ